MLLLSKLRRSLVDLISQNREVKSKTGIWILEIVCFFINHDWSWYRIIDAKSTVRWLGCDRCGYSVSFPVEYKEEN